MKSKSVKWNIIGGGEIHYGEVISIGEGYRVPDASEFNDEFYYERTDGYDWFQKKYDKYQKGDVIALIKQDRVRVKTI